MGTALLPTTRNRISAAATLFETLGMSVPRPFAPDVKPETAEVSGVTGRLYAPSDYPAILVVPGATPEGVEDSRVNTLALELNGTGRATPAFSAHVDRGLLSVTGSRRDH